MYFRLFIAFSHYIYKHYSPKQKIIQASHRYSFTLRNNMNDHLIKIGTLEDRYLKQKFSVLRSKTHERYYLLNDMIYDEVYFNTLSSFDRSKHLIKGIVASTVLSPSEYVTVSPTRNSVFSALTRAFKPSTDSTLAKFIYWREMAKISDIDKFIGCTRILQSFRLDEDEIPNSKGQIFDQKMFAFVLAEFDYNGVLNKKLFLQISEFKDYTSVRHIEITQDIYYFTKVNSVQKHFLIQLLT